MVKTEARDALPARRDREVERDADLERPSRTGRGKFPEAQEVRANRRRDFGGRVARFPERSSFSRCHIGATSRRQSSANRPWRGLPLLTTKRNNRVRIYSTIEVEGVIDVGHFSARIGLTSRARAYKSIYPAARRRSLGAGVAQLVERVLAKLDWLCRRAPI
jgi:hypothetical protein